MRLTQHLWYSSRGPPQLRIRRRHPQWQGLQCMPARPQQQSLYAFLLINCSKSNSWPVVPMVRMMIIFIGLQINCRLRLASTITSKHWRIPTLDPTPPTIKTSPLSPTFCQSVLFYRGWKKVKNCGFKDETMRAILPLAAFVTIASAAVDAFGPSGSLIRVGSWNV